MLRRILLQTLLLLGLYAASRMAFTLINLRHFAGISFWSFLKIAVAALRFDLTAICSLNALYFALALLPFGWARGLRFQQALQWLFVVVNAVALAFEISDWAYYPYNFRRATVDVLDMLGRKGDFAAVLPSLLRGYWYVLPALVAFIVALAWLNRRIVRATLLAKGAQTWRRTGLLALQWVLVMGGVFIGIRGGLQYIPIGLRNAVQAVPENRFVPIVLNTPFSIISSATSPALPARALMPDDEAWAIVKPIKKYPGNGLQKKNVVIIILESFSKEFTGAGSGTSYTPFLDSLAALSLECTNAWANGVRSAEGIPAIVSGIPTLMDEPFTTSPYGANQTDALPGLLAAEGYETAFFHGGTNGTMSLDVLAASAGFRHYYGRREYANERDYDGAWGIRDVPFLQYTAATLSAMQQPFCAAAFTLSSHPPYSLPPGGEQLYPAGPLPIHATVRYTDDALRQFFAAAARAPWFQNTLFIITADHCAPTTAGGLWEAGMWRYAVPLLYYTPGGDLPAGKDSTLTQHIDILPTVLQMLGYSKPFFAFGNSLTDATAARFSVHSWGGFSWLSPHGLLNLEDTTTASFYHFPQDSFQKNNLLKAAPREALEERRAFFAFLQVYTSALRENRMTVKTAGR